MITYPKRLIEVDLPIKEISNHARREKSIRHGHISTLHIWWARRPLAACRAVICAALWPDPVDPLCPQVFRKKAAQIISQFAKKAATDKNLKDHCSSGVWSRWCTLSKPENKIDPENHAHQMLLRLALLDFIADFANWDNSTEKSYLETSRALTQIAHVSLGGITGTKPLVIDPFAGGGSIPLEALRVGADAFASDLNPIPVMLNKVVLEYIPKYGQRLADDLRKWGGWIKEQAEKELSATYPRDPSGDRPIAYLWARTIVCEGPGCGAIVPIMPSLLLEKKGKDSTSLAFQVKDNRITLKLVNGNINNANLKGTAKRGSVTCPCCGYTTPVTSVRIQLIRNNGGAQSSMLLAVAIYNTKTGKRGYRLAAEHDFEAIKAATTAVDLIRKEAGNEIPDDILPLMSGVFNVPLYGHDKWSSLFTNRQLLLLITLSRLIRKVTESLKADGDIGFSAAISTLLSLALGKVADYSTSICTWVQSGGFVGHTFAQGQCLPIKFDFAESVPLAGFSGSWEGAIDWSCRIIEREATACHDVGQVERVSATRQALPDDSASCLITDPPYYNAVPYADLSDFFYTWHRRTLMDVHPDLFKNELAPKDEEICEMAGWDSSRYSNKTASFFENEIAKAFAESRRIVQPSGIGVIVFAHKTTTGWESLLQAIIQSGWMVTASWPIDTERASRLRAMRSAALGSSIHIVVRPRENPDGTVRLNEVGDWRDVLQELPQRINEWMPRLAAEGVVGADAIFACLGPALEIYSRYSSVEKASGEQVTLREYLEQVWAVVAKEALDMIFSGADTSDFEEDARLTAMWLWTLFAGGDNDDLVDQNETDTEISEGINSASSGYILEYDAARKIAQGLGAHIEKLRSLVEVKGEVARLLPVSERAVFLFGKDAGQVPEKKKKKDDRPQLDLFKALGIDENTDKEWDIKLAARIGETVLDRLHQSMILFAADRGEALKRFLVEDGVGRDQRFWRLAQAFSALYPSNTDEKRWVDGVLARKKGLGF